MKNTDNLQAPTTQSEVAIMQASLSPTVCSVCYIASQLQNSTRSASAINLYSCYRKYRANSQHSHREATSCYRESTLCVVRGIVSKKELEHNLKEDKGKSMMHVLYIVLLAKRNILGQSDIEK